MILEWATTSASEGFPRFPAKTDEMNDNRYTRLTTAHIIDNGISLSHQASNGRSMYYFTMVSAKIGPESSQVHLKLVEPE